jgi:hypothetical protein
MQRLFSWLHVYYSFDDSQPCTEVLRCGSYRLFFNEGALDRHGFLFYSDSHYFCFLCSGIAVSMVMKYADNIVKVHMQLPFLVTSPAMQGVHCTYEL